MPPLDAKAPDWESAGESLKCWVLCLLPQHREDGPGVPSPHFSLENPLGIRVQTGTSQNKGLFGKWGARVTMLLRGIGRTELFEASKGRLPFAALKVGKRWSFVASPSNRRTGVAGCDQRTDTSSLWKSVAQAQLVAQARSDPSANKRNPNPRSHLLRWSAGPRAELGLSSSSSGLGGKGARETPYPRDQHQNRHQVFPITEKLSAALDSVCSQEQRQRMSLSIKGPVIQ